MRSLRIVFNTFGSLGDLHPYLAIARALAQRGHQAVIASFEEFREPVAAAGAAFAPARPAMATFGDPAAVMRRLVDPWYGPRFLIRDMFMAHLRDTYDDLARAADGADVLVTHPLSFAGQLLAEKRGLRWVSTVLSPLSLFSAFDPPVFPGAPWLRLAGRLGPAAYRLLFGIPRALMRKWETPLRALRAELGLATPGPLAQMEGQYSPRLNLALFSPLLAPPQPDWPANTLACGFPRYDGEPADVAIREELQGFLAAGDEPLVFALGSSAVMVADTFWERAIDAARRVHRRAILLTGTPPEALGRLPADVRAFRYLPYSAVFPHAAVIVHSGGIGTLAQALAAGRPQLVVPVAFDQPDNARRAAALGVARTIPFREATGAAMAVQLSALLLDGRHAARAGSLGEALRTENAVETACAAMIEA